MKNGIENIEAVDEIYSIYQFSSHCIKKILKNELLNNYWMKVKLELSSLMKLCFH